MNFLAIVKAIIPLILIIGLLYGVLFFIRKYGISIKGKGSSLVNIKVLSSQLLMPKKYISVVKVEDKILVLGVSEHSISLLKEMDAKEEESNVNNYPPVDDQSFLKILKRNLGLR